MKKVLPYITVAVIILIIVALFVSMSTSQNMTVVYTGNSDKKPIKIALKKFQDSDCGMVIESKEYVSQVISPSGKTYFFHDYGGMAHWLSTKSFKDDAIIWVMTKDTKRYIDGRSAWYSRDDDTPMHYGFGAYEHKQKGFISFDEMSLHMLRGEHMGDLKIRKKLLEEKNSGSD